MQSLVAYGDSSSEDEGSVSSPSVPPPTAPTAALLAGKRPRVEFEIGPEGQQRVDLTRSLPVAVAARRGHGRFAAHAMFARRGQSGPDGATEIPGGSFAADAGAAEEGAEEHPPVSDSAAPPDDDAAEPVIGDALAAEGDVVRGSDATTSLAPAVVDPGQQQQQQQHAYWQQLFMMQQQWQAMVAQQAADAAAGPSGDAALAPPLPPPPGMAAAAGAGVVPPPPLPAPGLRGGGGGDKALRRELQEWGARAGRLVGESGHLTVAPTAAGFGAYVPAAPAPPVASSYSAYGTAVAAAAAAAEEDAAAAGGMVSISGAALRGTWAPPRPEEIAAAAGKKAAVPTKVWNATAGAVVVSRAEPSRLAKRKHQIGSLAAQAVASSASNLTHRSAGHQSKAQTRSEWAERRCTQVCPPRTAPPPPSLLGKYGW